MGVMHRNNQQEVLQRMAGVENVPSLKMLADLLKPTGLSVRARTRKYSSLVPLNRMVDALLPESQTAREFDDTVRQALANPSALTDDFRQIRTLLSAWKENAAGLKPVVGRSFLLEEIEPVAEFMGEFTGTGLQALDYLESRRKPTQEWKESAALLLARAEKPHAEMLIAIAPALKALIEAANAIPCPREGL